MAPNSISGNNAEREDIPLQISSNGKFWAGVFLIFTTVAAITMTIAFWPDKMPPLKDGDDGAWYVNKCFHVTLIGDSAALAGIDSASVYQAVNLQIASHPSADRASDSQRIAENNQTIARFRVANMNNAVAAYKGSKIHLNTILLLLVALMGFLGSMIHVATSFTNFIGNDTYKQSWKLWYFVKPFTASELAVVVYFIIRAGFLSYGSSAAGVSLYGILSLAALAGLFTDTATLKLKEIFEVIFKPKDDRKDKMKETAANASAPIPNITAASPLMITQGQESTISLAGSNLDSGDVQISFDGVAADAASIIRTPTSIDVKYTPTANAISSTKTVLLVTSNDGTPFTQDIAIS